MHHKFLVSGFGIFRILWFSDMPVSAGTSNRIEELAPDEASATDLSNILMEICNITLHQDSENVEGGSRSVSRSPTPRPTQGERNHSTTPTSVSNDTEPSGLDRSASPSPPTSEPVSEPEAPPKDPQRRHPESMSPLTELSQFSSSSNASPTISSVGEVEAVISLEQPVDDGEPGPSTSRPRKRRRNTDWSNSPRRSRGKSRKSGPSSKKARQSSQESDYTCEWPAKLPIEPGSVQKDVSRSFNHSEYGMRGSRFR